MREETINGTGYRIGKLSVKQQWNVVRKLGPVLASAGPILKSWADKKEDDTPPDIDELFSTFGPLAIAIGELSDETSDYIIGTCLSVCAVNRVGQTWAMLATPRGEIMFQDLELSTMLRLTLLTLQENLSGFLGGLAGSSPASQ